MADFFIRHQQALHDFSEMSRSIGSRADYVQGGGGNTSVKLEGGLMAIKASGFHLMDVLPDAGYAVLEGAKLRDYYLNRQPSEFPDIETAGAEQAKLYTLSIERLKTLRPSVEAGFHSLLSKFVAHSHSVYGNLAACCGKAEEVTRTALEGAPYSWALIPYVDPGVRLTFTIRDIIARVKRETGRTPGILLMQNHGLIAHHDDMRACLELHEDANARFQRYFSVTPGDFPKPAVRELADGSFASNTPWLKERLRGFKHPDAALMDEPLYPDQMVFFQGTLGSAAVISRDSGEVRYNTPQKNAQTIEETLCAVVFIRETLRRKGLTPVSMGEAARAFISGWESEEYRKKLAEGKG